MAMNDTSTAIEPTRAEIDALEGGTLLEFGSPTCGYCRAAQPLIAATIPNHPHIRHFKIADGPGRKLGRSLKVKLWPTLVFVNQGKEISRLVRPADGRQIQQALEQIEPPV